MSDRYKYINLLLYFIPPEVVLKKLIYVLYMYEAIISFI